MKKYNLSNIMKRAWELVKKVGMTISSGLKKAWKEAKKMSEIAKLKGTPKQVKWAEHIRNKMGTFLVNYREEMIEKGEKRKKIDKIQRSIELFITIDDSNFFIENRNFERYYFDWVEDENGITEEVQKLNKYQTWGTIFVAMRTYFKIEPRPVK